MVNSKKKYLRLAMPLLMLLPIALGAYFYWQAVELVCGLFGYFSIFFVPVFLLGGALFLIIVLAVIVNEIYIIIKENETT